MCINQIFCIFVYLLNTGSLSHKNFNEEEKERGFYTPNRKLDINVHVKYASLADVKIAN